MMVRTKAATCRRRLVVGLAISRLGQGQRVHDDLLLMLVCIHRY